MRKFEKYTAIAFAILFGLTFIGSLVGVLFFGAWWHMFTTAISAVLSFGYYCEAKAAE